MTRLSKSQKAFSKIALKKLNQGAEVFNSWKSSFPNHYLDLSLSNLSGLNLAGVQLSGARLKGAILKGTYLNGASLAGANLNGANLRHSDLSNVDLRQARLEKADLRESILDGSNLYASIREDWLIKGVKCTFCWISSDRNLFADKPDVFLEDEFETTYGGRRIRVSFPEGMQPIDLLALPYHVEKLIKKFPGQKIILAGLETTGEPRLVFRIDEEHDYNTSCQIETAFQQNAPQIRHDTTEMYNLLLESYFDKDKRADNNVAELIGVINELVKHPSTINISDAGMPFLIGTGTLAAFNENSLCSFFESVDVIKLETELDRVSKALDDLEKKELAHSVRQATIAVKSNQPNKARDYFVKSGKIILDVAIKIGAPIAAKFIMLCIGLE